MKRRSKKLSSGAAFAAVLLVALCLYKNRGGNATAAPAVPSPSVLVNITPLTRGSLPLIVTLYGNVGVAAAAQQTLTAPSPSQVASVFVQDGALVAAGAPLVRMLPTAAARAGYAQAQSALRLADALAARMAATVAGHLATQSQLLQAQNDAVDAGIARTALKLQGADGPHVLTAPFAALVTHVVATPGSTVAAGDALLQLLKPGQLVLNAGVVPAKAALVAPGNLAVLTPLGGGPAVAGAVMFRAAAVSSTDGMVAVAISLPPDNALLGEMFRADITVGRIAGYVVPHAAILIDDAGNTYIVQDCSGTAKVIDVQVLGADADQDVVAGPVIAAAPAVLAGNYQLNDGDSVRVAAAGNAAAP